MTRRNEHRRIRHSVLHFATGAIVTVLLATWDDPRIPALGAIGVIAFSVFLAGLLLWLTTSWQLSEYSDAYRVLVNLVIVLSVSLWLGRQGSPLWLTALVGGLASVAVYYLWGAAASRWGASRHS